MLIVKETDEACNNKKSFYGRFVRSRQKHELARGLNYCGRVYIRKPETCCSVCLYVRIWGHCSEIMCRRANPGFLIANLFHSRRDAWTHPIGRSAAVRGTRFGATFASAPP
ncbi:hypothetical protein Zmor_012710 [Zophobas morio]|uniref:Uncharacterized protein n=1 Tax=Zophobas morio TaxID=2755281 RepID=A0AA38IBK8_9CUCU|nr:hypothetical protein Zmor_012710 [Zophobas morio]